MTNRFSIEVERLRTRVAELEEALEFYADRATWCGRFPERPIDKDCDGDFRATPGKRARIALAKLEEG